MRRWVWRGVVCLGSGVLTTVAVAWGLSANRPSMLQYRATDRSVSTSSGTWEIVTDAQRGFVERRIAFDNGWITILGSKLASPQYVPFSDLPHSGETWGCMTVERQRTMAAKDEVLNGKERAVGWPFLALWWTENDRPHVLGSGQSSSPGGCFGGWRLHRRARIHEDVVLPWYPILPGLIANSVIYAVGWSVVIVAPAFWGRSRREAGRRRKGLCPRCGYDLVHKFEAGCSECAWNRA